MIKNSKLYRKLAEKRRWEALQKMSAEESLALGEALLTSQLMTLAKFPRPRRPKCLAVSLGIRKRFRPQGK